MPDETIVEPIQTEDYGTSTRDRQRSTIGFPYMNLEEAIGLAQAIYSNVGQGECTDDQLAPWLNLSPKSSGYRVRLSSARMFGLVEPTSDGAMYLSPLGRRIVDPAQRRRASVDAFLQVPLYLAVYSAFRGQMLPPSAALERQMIGMGVAEKQKSRARQVFEKSAEQAGFFEQGRNRLVKPGFIEGKPNETPPGETKDTARETTKGSVSGEDDAPTKRLDPIIKGLIDRLPASGEVWPANERELWLTILKSAFQLVYADKVETQRTETSSTK